MYKILTLFLLVSFFSHAIAQEYTAQSAPLPEKLAGLPQVMDVMHYPPTVHAIETEPGKYYWKHNTTVYCETSEITIKEFGSFLFYENKWNERVAMDPKDMDKLFGTKQGVMNQCGALHVYQKLAQRWNGFWRLGDVVLYWCGCCWERSLWVWEIGDNGCVVAECAVGVRFSYC